VLCAHIVAAGAWIGIDVLVAVLVGVAMLSGEPATQGLAYQALGTFVVWPMLGSALVCLLTGVVLGLGTKWGLVRYWWVAVKLVMNVALSALIVLVLRPGMPDVAEHGRLLSEGAAAGPGLTTLVFPPAVSLIALTAAVVLSVTKPWGRTSSWSSELSTRQLWTVRCRAAGRRRRRAARGSGAGSSGRRSCPGS
jgi:hypothetical protein